MSSKPIFFVHPIERIRREKLQRVRAFWVSVVALLALAALTGWLLWCVRGEMLDAGCWMLDFSIQSLGSSNEQLVAMAPVTQGSILGLLAFFSAALIVLAVRKVRADEVFFASLRREEDVFAVLREPGLPVPSEDAQRILVACAAEGREIQRLVKTALSVEDYEAALEVAHDRLTTLVACVEAVCERLAEQEPTKILKQGGTEV